MSINTKSGRFQILCIDADVDTARWINERLIGENIQCDLVTVLTGREGFRRLNSQDFDLCILEYALPDMTGVQLCALMRQLRSPVPMLFFTPMNRPIDRQNAEAAGAAAYIVKPDDLDIFVDTALHLMKRRGRLYAFEGPKQDLARAA